MRRQAHDETFPMRGKCGVMNGKYVCEREEGHKGAHCMYLPNITIGWETTAEKEPSDA